MKKLSLFLAVVMLFSVFAVSCGPDTDTSSSATSNDASQNVSDNTSTSKPSNDVITGISVRDDADFTVVSNGASYTTSKAPAENYPDTYGTELTDGIRVSPEAAQYGDASFVGFDIGYGNTVNINLDLGYTSDKIYAFSLGYLASKEAGCGAPGSVTVRVSADGKKWINRGMLKMPEFVEGTVLDATLTLPQYVNARYVRFTIKGNSSWIFLDEIKVYADVEGSSSNVEYLEAVKDAYSKLGALSAPSNGNDINRELNKTLVSSGAKYSVTGKVRSDFADDGKKLTDGNMSGYYEGGTWVGFEGNQDVTIKVDLGKKVDDIAAIEASFFVNVSTKIYLPVAVKITAVDGKNRTELGILYGNAVMNNGNYVFSLPLSKTISARTIELTLVSTDCVLHLVEEVAVYAYREKVNNSLYPDVVIETDDGSWKSGSGSAYENLILNKTQQIIAANDPGKENYANNTPVTSTLMTDGKLSNATGIHNNMFFKFNYGGERKVIYDLENIAAVDKFEASFTHQTDWAVNAPGNVIVYISNNGKDWYEAGEIKLEDAGDPALHRGTLKLSKKVQARYVVFSFDVIGWCGCDELQVYGTKSSSGAVAPEKAGLAKRVLFEGERIPPSNNIMGGAKDLCLLYHSEYNCYTEDDLLPYVAYLDRDGNIKDIMFDSVLFLYQNTTFPSGARPHIDSIKSDWDWVIDDLFTENENICALDSVVGKVKEELGLSDDYKYKFAVTLYYPSTTCTNFGDVDGDGVSENFSNYDDRIKAIKWFIEETEKRFAEANFENIDLVAYYWWHEEINHDDPDSEMMLNDISDLVHNQGRDFIWIPYFTANGYNKWAELGFDYAVMQPNYVFTADAPYSNVENCANLTALYGMGVEMELFEDVLTKELFFKKYMQYLAGGVEFGYMDDCIIMYYQSVYVLRNAANSKSAMARTVYEKTYHFIKGDLKYKPDVITGLKFEATKDTVFEGKIDFPEDNKLLMKLDIAPNHGSVTMNDDGTFHYYPEKGYTGEVKFSFSYSEYLGWSDPCEVTITVK